MSLPAIQHYLGTKLRSRYQSCRADKLIVLQDRIIRHYITVDASDLHHELKALDHLFRR